MTGGTPRTEHLAVGLLSRRERRPRKPALATSEIMVRLLVAIALAVIVVAATLGASDAADRAAARASADDLRAYLAEVGIAVEWRDVLPPDGIQVASRRPDDRALGRAARWLRAELQVHGDAGLRALGIGRLHLTAGLEVHSERMVCAISFGHGTTLLVDVEIAMDNTRFATSALHHELAHVMDYESRRLSSGDPEWQSLNSPLNYWAGIRPATERSSIVGHRHHVFPLTCLLCPPRSSTPRAGSVLGPLFQRAVNIGGVEYGKGGHLHRDPRGSLDSYAVRGFLNSYSLASVLEDRAEVFAASMTRPTYLWLRSRFDSVLRAKMALTRRRWQAFCSTYDDAFFANVVERRRELRRVHGFEPASRG